MMSTDTTTGHAVTCFLTDNQRRPRHGLCCSDIEDEDAVVDVTHGREAAWEVLQ